MAWYEIKNIDTIDSPALVIYKERVLENIRLLKSMKDAAHLRPHVKTNKIAEVCKMMLDESITKFKCATIAEAEMLAQCGAPDVLLAYQLTGPKIQRFLKLVQQYPDTCAYRGGRRQRPAGRDRRCHGDRGRHRDQRHDRFHSGR